MTNDELSVLMLHRERVAQAQNFQEFQEAQLDLLDYMINKADGEKAIHKATADFSAKFEEWTNK